jgi:isopentenyl diphosphate isomerase/L-lactate dehydrogenase-like FMN-dependent dehydrogenase
MLTLDRAASVSDLRRIARRRLPRFVFDFIDGASESEVGEARNRRAFERLLLMPRYLRNVETRDTGVELFGRKWGAPVGIAPTGMCGLVWPGGDLARARSAVRFNVPFVLSTAASSTIEDVAAIAPDHTWFQLYPVRDTDMAGSLCSRAESAGIKVLVVTVDVPKHGKRERDIRNGFVLPLRLTPANVADMARCPAWSMAMLRAGPPRFANLEPYMGTGLNLLSRAAFIESQSGGGFDWRKLERVRETWRGRLVLKGLMAPEDVSAAADQGVDGVIVSNHGGRQLDTGPAPIEMVRGACEAAGGRLEIMLDSGIRRGADIVRARALGAAFTFVGRAPLYGLAAGGGEAGSDAALRILIDEIDRALAQLGCTDFSGLEPGHVRESAW